MVNDSEENKGKTSSVEPYISGAVGAGLVLVCLPCVALYFGMHEIQNVLEVGLPIVAIFGIMILFGTMSLVSTLFARLGLSDNREALGLPPGSIRAAIALALVVLFSIISIMLFQTMAKPYVISGLSEADKNAIVANAANRVLAVERVDCPPRKVAAAPNATADGGGPATTSPSSGTAGSKAPPNVGNGASSQQVTAEVCYDLHLVQPPGQEAFDLAKQLLILIGTLMTAVTSFYFATQATVAANKSADSIVAVSRGTAPAPAALPTPAAPPAPAIS